MKRASSSWNDTASTAIAASRVRAERTHDLERVDDAKRAVQPAAGRLRVRVRTDQQCLAGIARSAQHIADAVDQGLETASV
jgi:hypothetical protein